ncbi:sugar transferase [Winogradskyella litorisediminis]|uniref:Sugar transferase n=1 Tax=Winogradskyella litorisediminis TaxID=1156618 RepID=A0ABW3N4G3_9FLAO
MKSFFDYFLAILISPLVFPFIILFAFISSLVNGGYGFFVQKRIGKDQKPFNIYKLRTYNLKTQKINNVSRVLRKYKIDEMPQIFNVLAGEMSFVGPRPDIKKYADLLRGEEKKILLLKPGITGPASLKYFNEEELLSKIEDKQTYYDEVIFKDKIKINLDYYYNNNMLIDSKILIKTILKLLR